MTGYGAMKVFAAMILMTHYTCKNNIKNELYKFHQTIKSSQHICTHIFVMTTFCHNLLYYYFGLDSLCSNYNCFYSE